MRTDLLARTRMPFLGCVLCAVLAAHLPFSGGGWKRFPAYTWHVRRFVCVCVAQDTVKQQQRLSLQSGGATAAGASRHQRAEVDAHVVRVTDRLNSYAQRLIALESSADAATVTDDKYLQRFKDLVQRVEEHKVMLQKHSRSFQDRAAAVEAADAALLQALDEDVRYSNRQLAQLKARGDRRSASVVSARRQF